MQVQLTGARQDIYQNKEKRKKIQLITFIHSLHEQEQEKTINKYESNLPSVTTLTIWLSFVFTTWIGSLGSANFTSLMVPRIVMFTVVLALLMVLSH